MRELVLTLLGAGAAAVAIHKTIGPGERRRRPLPSQPTRAGRRDPRHERPGPIDWRGHIR